MRNRTCDCIRHGKWLINALELNFIKDSTRTYLLKGEAVTLTIQIVDTTDIPLTETAVIGVSYLNVASVAGRHPVLGLLFH